MFTGGQHTGPHNTLHMPQIISMPKPGQFYLGGNTLFPRNIDDYKKALKKVTRHRDYKGADNGKWLCLALMKQEFTSQDMRTKNITGLSFDKSKRRIRIPQLDPVIIGAIFKQAAHQYPGFTDSPVKSRTVDSMNNSCKHERRK